MGVSSNGNVQYGPQYNCQPAICPTWQDQMPMHVKRHSHEKIFQVFHFLFKILSCFCYSVIWKPHTCGAKHFSGPATLKDWWECLKGYPLHDCWTRWGKAGDQHNNCTSKLRWYRHKVRASWLLCFFETDFTKIQEMVRQGHHSSPLQQYS